MLMLCGRSRRTGQLLRQFDIEGLSCSLGLFLRRWGSGEGGQRRGAVLEESAPFTEAEKAAIGSGNWERLTGHVTTARGGRR